MSDVIERLRALTVRGVKRRDWVALGQAIQDYDRMTDYRDVVVLHESPERWAELTDFQQYCALTAHHPTGRRSGGGRIIRCDGPRISIPTSGGSSQNYVTRREQFFEWLERGGYTLERSSLLCAGREVLIGAPPPGVLEAGSGCQRKLP